MLKGNEKRTGWLALPLCLLTLVGLGVQLVPQPEPGRILQGGAVWALAAFGLWFVYRQALSCGRILAMKRLWLLAAVFAAVMTLGSSYGEVDNASLVSGQPVIAALYFAGRVPLYAAGMALLTNALWHSPSGGQSQAQTAGEGGLQKKRPPLSGWLYGLILLACWCPWLFFIWPGTVSNDSVTMIMEAIGLEKLANGNPIFQTFVLHCFRWLGVRLGNGDITVALYCLIQSVLMAWLLGVLIRRMLESSAPRWIGLGSLIFFAVNPIFPLYAFCIGKDTNFAMAVLWLMLCCHELCGRQKYEWKNTLCLCAAAVLCVLLRNPGMYLAVLTLAALLVWTLKKPRRSAGLWIAPAASILCALCVFIGIRLMLPVLGVAPMPETEEYSVPLQQVARVAATHPLTEEESAAIDGVLELDRVAADYNGELSDPIKFLWREDATPEAKAAFFRMWPRLVAKYPGTCFSATFHNTYGYVYPGYMSQIKPTLLIGRQKTTTLLDPYFRFSVNPRSDLLIRLTDELAENPLYRVIIAPGLYGWLTMFGVCLLLGRGKGRYLIAAVPMLFTLAGCMLSAVNGYFRYSMPLYLCVPMLLWLCALAKPNSGRETV